jgi:hypothetical protein
MDSRGSGRDLQEALQHVRAKHDRRAGSRTDLDHERLREDRPYGVAGRLAPHPHGVRDVAASAGDVVTGGARPRSTRQAATLRLSFSTFNCGEPISFQ